MTITASQLNDNGASFRAQGRHFDDAATPGALVLDAGFAPRYISWENLTDSIKWEWYAGMAAGTSIKTVAVGTRTLDTADVAISPAVGEGNQTGGSGTVGSGAGAQVINDDTKTQIVGSGPSGEFTIASAVNLQNKQYQWVAEG